MMRTLLVILALLTAVAHAGPVPEGWRTYRSDRFGWELSYPPEMELKAFLDGGSAELREAETGTVVAELDVWPADLCPRERPGTTAEALGTERVAAVTQADGDGASSSCGAPTTVRRWDTHREVPLYEVALTCRSERIVGHRTVRRREGRKAPTFFADVSQPWRRRVLMMDPVGVDPRAAQHPPDIASVRRILETLATFPLPDPKVVCIEDLGAGAASPAVAGPR